jgi:siroheme synthase
LFLHNTVGFVDLDHDQGQVHWSSLNSRVHSKIYYMDKQKIYVNADDAMTCLKMVN